jgi:hypothetical protein
MQCSCKNGEGNEVPFHVKLCNLNEWHSNGGADVKTVKTKSSCVCTSFGCFQAVQELYRNLCCGREDRSSRSIADTGSRVRFGNLCSLSLSLSLSLSVYIPHPYNPRHITSIYCIRFSERKNYKLWESEVLWSSCNQLLFRV